MAISSMQVRSFFDQATSTVTHVVSDRATGRCAVIDPVHDFDPASAHMSTESADQVIRYIESESLVVDWLLETHAHADHLSASSYLRDRLGGRIAIGKQITAVQQTFSGIYNLDDSFKTDGSQFDQLLGESDVISIGQLSCRIMETPGHTPACISYCIGDMVFVGDTLFMPDYGTARCDFPGGDAAVLYRSIHKILSLPGETRIFLCHDYPPTHREPRWETTVDEQRKHNVHVGGGVSEAEFVAMRKKRDTSLSVPALLIPSIQVNIRAGQLPPNEDNGVVYLKVPVNTIGGRI